MFMHFLSFEVLESFDYKPLFEYLAEHNGNCAYESHWAFSTSEGIKDLRDRLRNLLPAEKPFVVVRVVAWGPHGCLMGILD